MTKANTLQKFFHCDLYQMKKSLYSVESGRRGGKLPLDSVQGEIVFKNHFHIRF